MAHKTFADPLFPRRETTGSVVAVLRTSREDRGLKLIQERTRCIRRFDIHELLVTDEADPKPGRSVEHIGYFGFMEFEVGGVIAIGDLVLIDEKPIGRLVGFGSQPSAASLPGSRQSALTLDGVVRPASTRVAPA